ncbi:MAG TPA: ABC transporter ATP-binding protein [Clostridia bacterium]|nr:ABC transporter ATP-binding protein [Clostridia bacterium]
MHREYIRKILHYSRPYWKAQFCILILWTAISLLGALVPFINREIINLMQSKFFLSKLISLLLALFVIRTTVVILNFIAEYRFEYLQKEATADFFQKTYESLQKLPIERLISEKGGEYISKILSDGEMAGIVVSGFFPSTLLNLLRFLVVIAVLIYLNPILGIISVIFIPFYFFVFKKYSKGIIESSQEERISYANVLESLKEKIEGLPIAIFYKQENFLIKKFLFDIKEWLKNIRKVIFNMKAYTASYSYLSAIFPLVIFGVGAVLVSIGRTDIGTMIAFYLYSENLFEPLSNFSKNLGAFSQVIPPFNRVLTIIETTYTAPDGTRTLRELKSISLNGLTVKYGDKEVLDNINLKLDFTNNVNIAIVGCSGSGKSTLVRFLSGYFDSERCLINDVPITAYSKKSLRKHILLVSNTDFIFGMTVRENLSMGENFSEEEMEYALKLCGLNFGREFLNTKVGEGGKALSTGERQRLALARAILRKPTLLILDEALSGVDAETENVIFKNIKAIIPNLIVISHRLSTVLQCREIYVLDKGKIAAIGTHEELLASCPTYRDIIKEQLIENRNNDVSVKA